MRIYLGINSSDPKTGKGFFFHRLADCLTNYSDIKIIFNIEEYSDIALHNTYVKNNNAKKNVVRIDGVYHNTGQNYNKLNKSAFRNFHNAPDGVIYQSCFSKNMADQYLGKFKGHTAVIPNGANPHFYEDASPINTHYKYNFIAAARWRPHKRLKDIIESFLIANIEDAGLYVAGDLKKSGLTSQEEKKYFSIPSITYLGILKQNDLARYLVSCNIFLHLCWIDWCPNGVVEAICANVPVITNNVGGTQEMVLKSGGYVLSIDKPYDCNPCNLYSPPPINRKLVAETMINSIKSKLIIDHSYVDINNVAIQYREFFEKILESKK
jgi:glycosyltransferase involved in cell wall biosynthesis